MCEICELSDASYRGGFREAVGFRLLDDGAIELEHIYTLSYRYLMNHLG